MKDGRKNIGNKKNIHTFNHAFNHVHDLYKMDKVL